MAVKKKVAAGGNGKKRRAKKRVAGGNGKQRKSTA